MKKKQEVKVGDLVINNYGVPSPLGLVIQVEKKFYRSLGAVPLKRYRLRIYWLTGPRKSVTSVEPSSVITVLKEKKE